MSWCDIIIIGCDNIENVKINIDYYIEYGLGDIYYGLINFISKYVTDNYNTMEFFKNGESKYAVAIATMKSALKELLDCFKRNDEVYLPSLNRNVKISNLNVGEQLALEERCKEYLVTKLNETLGENLEAQTSHKKI